MLKSYKALIYILLAIVMSCSTDNQDPTEILWDTWGIPHIFGKNKEEMFYAFGSAQMASHGDLLLRMYGESRGRGAEYFGESQLEWDQWIRTMKVTKRAKEWYNLQSPEFNSYLEAFVEGINDYATNNPSQITDSLKVVLPVNAVDVLAYVQRALHLTFVAGPWMMGAAQTLLKAGSNAWAIGPTRSSEGNAMLLANPHLSWDNTTRLFEAHLVAPGVNEYGATIIGFPVLVIAFNERLGWTHTVNAIDPIDVFVLTVKEGRYIFNQEIKIFEEHIDTLIVRNPDNTFREEELISKWSIHGPVVAVQDDIGIAMRMVGLNCPGILEQWWEMGLAQNLPEFVEAINKQQIPFFTITYADQEGHIMYNFSGQVPLRSRGDFNYWSSNNRLRGDTSSSLWTEILGYENLPRVIDPPSGWLHNTNDPPWTTTYPTVLNPADFPSYITPGPVFWARNQISARMLSEDDHITYDEMIEYKHSTRIGLADLILDDLIKAAQEHGSDLSCRAAEVLSSWDRKADKESRGAVLFIQWGREIQQDLMSFWGLRDEPLFSIPWSIDAPFTSPRGLADPEKAVKALEVAALKIEEDYNDLNVSWGEVYRLKGNGKNLPANGGEDPFGIFRSVSYQRGDDGSFTANGGDSFVAAIEFTKPVRARVLLTYGNATQPNSTHLWDQLDLFAEKELREAWLTREDIESNLELKQTITVTK